MVSRLRSSDSPVCCSVLCSCSPGVSWCPGLKTPFAPPHTAQHYWTGSLTLSSSWPVAGSRRHASLIRFCCSSKMITNRNGRRVTGCLRSFLLAVPSPCTALRARTVLAWNGVQLTGLRWERSASVHGTRRDMQSESRVGVFSSKGRQIFTHFTIYTVYTLYCLLEK